MKLKKLLQKFNRNYFYLMHLSYGGQKREELWQYAYKNNLIGLDFEGIDIDWSKTRQQTRETLTHVWKCQFKLFCEEMQINDIVLVTDGMNPSYLLGVGKVDGDYYFLEKHRDDFFGHVRRVGWIVKYKYENRQPFEAYFRRTLLRVDPSSSFWKKLIDVEIGIKNSALTLQKPRPTRKSPMKEVEHDEFISRGQESQIDIEKEIEELNKRDIVKTFDKLERWENRREKSDIVDLSAKIELVKADYKIDTKPIYVMKPLNNKEKLTAYKQDIKKFRKLISRIEKKFGVKEGKFTFLCIDDTPNRDALVFNGIILCNVIKYQKRDLYSYWLITLAREFAYLMNPRRDMRHMNIMRELLIEALRKTP